MPGMMDTILNLGLNDTTVQGVIKATQNERFAYDCYRRFVAMYGDVVLGCKPQTEDEADPFEELLEGIKDEKGVRYDTDLTAADLKELVGRFKQAVLERTGQTFPEDPREQLWGAITGRLRAAGTTTAPSPTGACTTSPTPGAPPSTCRPWCSATRATLGHRRRLHAQSRQRRDEFYVEFLANAQGEDVVAGVRTPRPVVERHATSGAAGLRRAHARTAHARAELRDMQDFEFTIEDGRSSCCRRATASAPRPAASASPSTWSTRG